MSVILYARVSTTEQADRDLSIPTQLRLLREYAREHRWVIAGEYQDVASGRSMHGRTGLVSAMRQATRDRTVDRVLVHRLDRFARNVFTYLTLKGRLHQAGVNLICAVEDFEATPLGSFMEHIMAAQAEFFSAKLGVEVRAGLQERLSRGLWVGVAPLGYVTDHGRVVPDPARAHFIRRAFELWALADTTTVKLGDQLHSLGFTTKNGKKLRTSGLCRLLKNPFYAGHLVSGGANHQGSHHPLISEELFQRAQAVFAMKGSCRRKAKRLSFMFARKIRCPKCLVFLIGEEHIKKSGKKYRYYRCHTPRCYYTERAAPLEVRIQEVLLKTPILQAAARQLRKQTQVSDPRVPQPERLPFHEELQRWVSYDELDRLAKHLSADPPTKESSRSTSDKLLLDLLVHRAKILRGSDIVRQCRLVHEVVQSIDISGSTPQTTWTSRICELAGVREPTGSATQ